MFCGAKPLFFMAKTREQKEQHVEEMIQGVKSATSLVIANFQGLKVSEAEELRDECRKQGIRFIASKKTLLKKALTEAGYTVDTDQFEGSPAVAFGMADDVAPAQILAKFAKKHELLKIFGGVLEGSFIDAAKVKQLSELPSRQQLLGQLVGTLNAPVSGFVNVLAGNIRGFVTVLNALKDQKA